MSTATVPGPPALENDCERFESVKEQVGVGCTGFDLLQAFAVSNAPVTAKASSGTTWPRWAATERGIGLPRQSLQRLCLCHMKSGRSNLNEFGASARRGKGEVLRMGAAGPNYSAGAAGFYELGGRRRGRQRPG